LATIGFVPLCFTKKILGKGEDVGGNYVHLYCGGGVLAGGLWYGLAAANLDINTTNTSSMARALDASNLQSVSELYSDDLGF
jgi:hypothetical protein